MKEKTLIRLLKPLKKMTTEQMFKENADSFADYIYSFFSIGV